jgi:glycosyltransferase involved in cell wall biosynthesis
VRLLATAVGYAPLWRRFWWEQVTLRRWLKRWKADVLFSTGNFALIGCPVRQLLLVANALYFSKIYRDTFMVRHSLRFWVPFELRRWLICWSVRQADVVLTPTKAMLDDLRRYVEVPDSKALVNHYGVEPILAPPLLSPVYVPEGATHPRNEVRLLFVSLYAEHKNLSTLLRAMPMLNSEGANNFRLKTTVNPAWKNATVTCTYREDLKLAMRSDTSLWVEFVGPLNREEVPELYQSADIFVFPSLTESFGHPMVEAMAHGLPIIAANTPVNREICGEGAVYFSPHSPEDLAQQVRRVWADGSLRAALGAAGRKRAALGFHWEEHVRRITEAAMSVNFRARAAREDLEGLTTANL